MSVNCDIFWKLIARVPIRATLPAEEIPQDGSDLSIQGSPDNAIKVGETYVSFPASSGDSADATFGIQKKDRRGQPSARSWRRAMAWPLPRSLRFPRPSIKLRLVQRPSTGLRRSRIRTAHRQPTSGYRIYYGTSASALNQIVDISNPGLSSYVVANLSPATWFFGLRAYTSSGAESDTSYIATKTIQ
jgi:hypothetical protein